MAVPQPTRAPQRTQPPQVQKPEQAPSSGESVATTSEKFVRAVERQFAAQLGDALRWSDYQKTLAQHLFVRVDQQLKALEAKRTGDGAPLAWENVNMPKLALDAVHRVNLGLDALIPNHIHPVPYWNKRISKYDLDLRIGYVGEDYCRRELAVVKPVEVVYQLVHETDTFVPYLRDRNNTIETYEFTVNKPFDRGAVVGGFGYIRYADESLNRLVIVTQRDFKKAEAAAKSGDFWGENKFREEMQFKTVVHRVAAKLPLDPMKVNAASWAAVQDAETDAELESDMDRNANGPVIDITPEHMDDDPAGEYPAGQQAEAERAAAAGASDGTIFGAGSAASADPY